MPVARLSIIVLTLVLLAKGCAMTPGPARYDSSWGEPSPTVWNFQDPSDRFAALSGNGRMAYRDPLKSGWGPEKTKYKKASGFGLPPLPGGDADVMRFPATSSGQGYRIIHNSPPNGVLARKGRVSNYTLIMDILWPVMSQGKYRSIYQTDPANEDDSEMYVNDSKWNGVGINAGYHGSLESGRWHRLAISVQAASGPGGVGQMHKFIDGRFIGGHGTNSEGPVSRWTLGTELLLFTDGDQETMPGYVASIYFIDRRMSMDEIAALGGPTAKGANVPGPITAGKIKKLPRRVGIVAHRGDSCCAPENTLSSISRALDRGAEWIESDIRWSKDDIPILMHDEMVDRTTNGSGRASEMTLSELKMLDAGSWFGPEFTGVRIPTLVEALTLAKGRARLILDVKGIGMGVAINRALKEAGVGPDAIRVWQGSANEAMKDFKRNIPEGKILWGAVPKKLDKAAFNELKANGIVGFDLAFWVEPVTAGFIEAAHRNGMFVSVYTILDPYTMREAVKLGVDAIETDFPGILNEMQP